MSSDEPTTGTTNPRRRILWLVVGHVVVWTDSGFRSVFRWLWSYAAASGLCWHRLQPDESVGNLGRSWNESLVEQTDRCCCRCRLISVCCWVFSICVPAWEASYFIVSVGTALITGVLLVVRCFRVRICVATVDQAAAHRMQFTIRQLLVLTFAVACLVSLGKWLAPHLMNVTEPLLLTLIGLVFATVGLLSVWPALGARHPVLPSLILIVVAAGVGFCFAQFLPPTSGMASFWMTITSVEALVLVASLVVVRSCGYRLVRLPSRRQGEAVV